jgi:hypothetical protein
MHGDSEDRPSHSSGPILELACMQQWDELRAILNSEEDIPEKYLNEVGGTWGYQPIHYCAQSDQTDLMRLFVKRGVSLSASNAQGWTALHLAASELRVEMVSVLLQLGANPHVTIRNGGTARVLAAGSYWASKYPEKVATITALLTEAESKTSQ